MNTFDDDRHILVVGAQGIIGRAVMSRCVADGIAATGVGRRRDQGSLPGCYRSVDLLDGEACARNLGDLASITHVVFAAWQAGETRQAEIEPNLTMLRNVVEIVERAAPGFRHLSLLQGVKAYGSHLGPFRQPARETDPRHMPPNFYYDQEDYIRARANSWSWTIFRPVTVCGLSDASSMSLTILIAVYASISRALALPLRFPGTEGAYEALRQMVDADLLAEAIVGAGNTDRCAGEIFNINNGDVVRWSHLWPGFAELFGMQSAEPQRIPLTEFMSANAGLWSQLTRQNKLVGQDYKTLVAWQHGETLFSRDYGNLLNTTKFRTFGFGGFADTEEMFIRQFRRLADARIIPPLR